MNALLKSVAIKALNEHESNATILRKLMEDMGLEEFTVFWGDLHDALGADPDNLANQLAIWAVIDVRFRSDLEQDATKEK